MSAKILAFPRPAPRLVPAASLGELLKRRDDPALTYFEREHVELAIDMHRAAGHFLTLPEEPQSRDAGIAAGANALEGALFHALCMKGCSNDDRELVQLLARRHMKRCETAGATR